MFTISPYLDPRSKENPSIVYMAVFSSSLEEPLAMVQTRLRREGEKHGLLLLMVFTAAQATVTVSTAPDPSLTRIGNSF